METRKPQITINKDTLLPISLVLIILGGAVRVERIGWISDQVTVRAAENSIEIKAQGKQIDEVKTEFLKAVNEIKLQLAEIKGARNGQSKETSNSTSSANRN